MADLAEIAPVLAAYPSACQPHRVEYLNSAGGFSGARLWRLSTPLGQLCLRRWPPAYPPAEQLQFIQAVLWHVDHEGCRLVPLPLETSQHAGYVKHDGALWELSPWLPGAADYRRAPSYKRLEAALMALAEFHLAAASFPLADIGPSRSPGMVRRRERMIRLRSGGLGELSAAIHSADWPQLATRARELVRLFTTCSDAVMPVANLAANLLVPLEPCIRDIWHDHVLFVDDAVSGLVDFGSMQPDNVTTDIARLLGSLVGDDSEARQHGLAAYESIRPLSHDEHLLVTAFDRTTVLMSGLQWLEWIYLERRVFADRIVIEARLDEILERLLRLASGRS